MTLPRHRRRLLLVHAHPDDETIGNGATMAKYAADGAHVTLVTCTLGEEGEIHRLEHAHHAADRNDTLGEHRATSSPTPWTRSASPTTACSAAPGKYRDSGMMGTTDNDVPRSFWRADLLPRPTISWRSSGRSGRRCW